MLTAVEKAKTILKCDEYYLRNAGEYAEYFLTNMNMEEKLFGENERWYLFLNKQYGLARQAFQANDDNEQIAGVFLAAHASLAEFRVANGSVYESALDYFNEQQKQKHRVEHGGQLVGALKI